MILFEIMPWNKEGYIDPGIYTNTYDSNHKDTPTPSNCKNTQVS